MKNKMAVGIITYNNEKHILETLQSIQKQSFKKFDLLISDDLSTDNTLGVIKYFIKKNYKLFKTASAHCFVLLLPLRSLVLLSSLERVFSIALIILSAASFSPR